MFCVFFDVDDVDWSRATARFAPQFHIDFFTFWRTVPISSARGKFLFDFGSIKQQLPSICYNQGFIFV
jgi:hypothetical protein